MQSPALKDIVCAHSPDSDDAFMFYALATRKLRSSLVNFKHVLSDIETLNQKAREGEYELTAISYHAYPYVADKYRLMAAGSSVGDGYGPMIIATSSLDPASLKGKRIAVPGKLTTAFLALQLYQPDFVPVMTPFDKIPDAVSEKAVDAGLVIHEAQLTFAKGGFHKVVDLGAWWKQRHDLPLPLGANALLRSLSEPVQRECCRLMRESIQYALDNREQALEYAMQFARDMDPALADKFVGMYVNHDTVDAGERVPKAAQLLLDEGYASGLIPHKVELDFIR
ncbi:MAG: MqnA/MqnD/SBP family protein [Bryobacteraceae bacterium]|nr:MqnA/MqnD/SBP family protein [Bryobacteraceae bacterium]